MSNPKPIRKLRRSCDCVIWKGDTCSPPPLKLPSKRWRDIAVVDDPRLIEKILRHLGAWHDPPPRPPRPDGSGPYTCEPCEDVNPTPDYENVLTD
jgi:hypothetical protein